MAVEVVHTHARETSTYAEVTQRGVHEGKCAREAIPKEHANIGARPLFSVQPEQVTASLEKNRPQRGRRSHAPAAPAAAQGQLCPRATCHAPPGPYHLTRPWFILTIGGV